MEQEELLLILEGIVSGLSKLLGEDTEIALHDLDKQELVYIANGHITERAPGYKLNPSVYDVIIRLADPDGHVIGYGTRSSKGKQLRSSHFLIRDKQQVPRALICINQDTAKLQAARDLLSSMISLRPLSDSPEPDESDINYIQKMTQQVIVNAIEKMKPTSIDTRESKLEVLRQLELKGVFAVKDAVPNVCRLLSISQATLYNYLREIRSRDTAAARQQLQI